MKILTALAVILIIFAASDAGAVETRVLNSETLRFASSVPPAQATNIKRYRDPPYSNPRHVLYIHPWPIHENY